MLRARAILFLAGMLIPSAILASPPPVLPIPLPRIIQLPTPPAISPTSGVGPRQVLTIESVPQLGLSPTVERSILAHLSRKTSTSNATTTGDNTTAIAPRHASPFHAATAGARPFQPVTETLVASPLTLVCCDDANAEQETALITNTLPNGVDYTVTAFMQFSNNNPPASGNKVWVKSSANSLPAQLPIRYSASGDPAVAENPYPSNIAGDRIYVVATDGADDQLHYPPSALEIWYTDNGGVSWTRPTNPITSEAVGSGHRHFDDKPSIAVSWWANTLGTVYAAAVRVDLDSGDNHDVNPNEIVIFRSDNGGVTFAQTARLSRNGSSYGSEPLPNSVPQSPQIVVDQNTGAVYLFWLEWSGYPSTPSNSTNANHIFVAKSDASATGWDVLSAQALAAGTFLGRGSDYLVDGTGVSLLAQRSMLNTRMNAFGRVIGLVWHAKESNGEHADIRYNAFDTTIDQWRGMHTVNQTPNDGKDQWNGALDNDGSGTVMVTYYDRRDDAHRYRMYATKLYPDGTRYAGADTAVQRLQDQPPSEPEKAVHAFDQGPFKYYTVGEYQDLWYWRDWKGAFIYAPTFSPPGTTYNTNCAIYHSDVTP